MKKRNKVLIITAIIFVVIALVFIILGFQLSGNDVLAWFGSKWAMLIYSVFAVYVIIVGYILIGDKIKKL